MKHTQDFSLRPGSPNTEENVHSSISDVGAFQLTIKVLVLQEAAKGRLSWLLTGRLPTCRRQSISAVRDVRKAGFDVLRVEIEAEDLEELPDASSPAKA